MNRILLTTTLTFAAITPLALQGADFDENPNRFSFGPRFGLNFRADFHNNGSFFQSVNPGPAAGGANHTYNDGYVLVDGSGDAGGLTSNWGYQNASQVAGNALQFHGIQTARPSSAADNPQYGAEFVYQRVLGSLPGSSRSSWGLETGFGFTRIDLRENHSETVPVTTDSYSLNGTLPPGAGYNGTFAGPGTLLGDTPTRTTTSATIASHNQLRGGLLSLRLGPFIEWHFTRKLSLAASVGLTLAPTRMQYDFDETATLAGGGGSFATSGHSRKTQLLYGPYVGGVLHYDLVRNWGVYLGAQFQNLTELEQTAGNQTARFDPGATVNLTAGASWSF